MGSCNSHTRPYTLYVVSHYKISLLTPLQPRLNYRRENFGCLLPDLNHILANYLIHLSREEKAIYFVVGRNFRAAQVFVQR